METDIIYIQNGPETPQRAAHLVALTLIYVKGAGDTSQSSMLRHKSNGVATILNEIGGLPLPAHRPTDLVS